MDKNIQTLALPVREEQSFSSASEDQILIGWVVGFTDGEGCFCVSFSKRTKFKTGLEVRPSFSITQKADSKLALNTIESFFPGGGLRYSKKDGTWKYEMRNLSHLVKTILPFFQKYPLKTEKNKDFVLFSQICLLMKSNQHLNQTGLENIIEKAFLMNSSGQRKYSKEYLLNSLKLLSVSNPKIS